MWVSLQVGPLLGRPFPAVVRGLPLYSSSRRVDVVSSAVKQGRLAVALFEQDGALWAAETNRSAIASSIKGHGRSPQGWKTGACNHRLQGGNTSLGAGVSPSDAVGRT